MTDPSSLSPPAPASDAELLRLAGKLREVGQALDRRFLDNEDAQKMVGEVDKLLEGIFESS
jgi:hypothetical protein